MHTIDGLLHTDFTQSVAPNGLHLGKFLLWHFPGPLPLFSAAFHTFPSIYFLACVIQPLLLILNIWLPALPQTPLKCLPPPRAAEEPSSIFCLFCYPPTFANSLPLVCSVDQLCPTLCEPMDCSQPGSSVHGIFFRQECWNGLPFPPPGDLPNPGIKPVSPALVGKFFTTVPPGKPSLILTKANTPPPFSSLIFSTLSSLSLSLLLLSYKSL